MDQLPPPPVAPITPLGARTPHAHPALYGVITILSFAIIALSAYVLLGRSPQNTPSPTDTPSANWTYNNSKLGIAITFPAHWEPYVVPNDEPTAVAHFQDAQHPRTLSGTTPTDTAYNGISLSASDEGHTGIPGGEKRQFGTCDGLLSPWNHIEGFGSTRTIQFFRQTSSTLVDILISAASTADEAALDAIIDTLTCTKTLSSSPLSSTLPRVNYQATNFKFSLQLHAGLEVYETSDMLLVAKRPFTSTDIGSDNAFFRLVRYANGKTKASELSACRDFLDNATLGTVVVDGYTFPTCTGTIKPGSFEAQGTGTMVIVYFDASMASYTDTPWGNPVDFDAITIGSELIELMHFTD